MAIFDDNDNTEDKVGDEKAGRTDEGWRRVCEETWGIRREESDEVKRNKRDFMEVTLYRRRDSNESEWSECLSVQTPILSQKSIVHFNVVSNAKKSVFFFFLAQTDHHSQKPHRAPGVSGKEKNPLGATCS